MKSMIAVLVLLPITLAFGDTGVQFSLSTSPVQPGYLVITGTNGAGALTGTFTGQDVDVNVAPTGTLTVTLSGGASSGTDTIAHVVRDRGNPLNGGYLTTGPVYESYGGYNLATAGTSGWLSLSGLNAGTPYYLTLYSYDYNVNGNTAFTDYTTGTAGPTTTETYTAKYNFASDPNADIQFTAPLFLTSDQNGNALVQVTGTLSGAPFAVLNGVIISPLGTSGRFTTGTSTPSQPGFTTYVAPPNGPGSITGTSTGVDPSISPSGTVTITMNGGTSPTDIARSRLSNNYGLPADNGTFTYGPVYSSWSGFTLSSITYTWIKISGLNPYDKYKVTLYAYDNSYSGSMTYTDVTAMEANTSSPSIMPGDSATISWTADSSFSVAGDNSKYSASLSIISDNGGNAVIKCVGNTAQWSLVGFVNALTITTSPSDHVSIGDIQVSNSTTAVRDAIYKRIGVGMTRFGFGWGNIEAVAGTERTDPQQGYFDQVIADGLRLKCPFYSSAEAPSWWWSTNANAEMVTEAGTATNSMISPFFNYTNAVTNANNILFQYAAGQTSYNSTNMLQSLDYIIIDCGTEGEAIYNTSLGQHFYFYGPTAQANFVNAVQTNPTNWPGYYNFNNLGSATNQPYYPTIAAANTAWGTGFTNWNDVVLPMPGSTTVVDAGNTGTFTYSNQYWNDILMWYRNTKRNWVDFQIKQFQSQLAAYAPTNHIPKLMLLIPSTHMQASDWNNAVTSHEGDAAIEMMVDSEFLLMEANKYGCIAQYDGETGNTASEAAYLQSYINSSNYNVPLWAENSGGATNTPVQLGQEAITNNQFGLEYINASNIFESDDETPNTNFPTYQQSCQMLNTNFCNPAGP